MQIYRIPCIVTYIGSVTLGTTEIVYAEKIYCLAVMEDANFETAVQHLLFGEEPLWYSPETRSPACRWALEGQDPQLTAIFDANREEFPLQNIQNMLLLENSVELL